MGVLTRRRLGAAAGAGLLAAGAPGLAAAQDGREFARFLDGVRADARRRGVRDTTLDRAFGGLRLDPHVLELDRHQPEFTLTWAEYRAKVVGSQRLADARAASEHNRALLLRVRDRYGVDPGAIVGIWGLESNFGARTGSFNVVQSLATLAYDGRRASYFRGQLVDSLRILDHGDVAPSQMTGSWAGAMGQPQFMPDSYLAYAVDFDGTGRRDIWTNRADVFASIANYLARSGWRPETPIAQPIRVPDGLDTASTGRERARPLGEWMRDGVRRDDGSRFSRTEPMGAVVLPDGPGGEAFMTYANFRAVRRYNPSDFYALAVALIGDAVPL